MGFKPIYFAPKCTHNAGNASQRPKFKNGISNLYNLLKSALKMQEMPFQGPIFQNIFGRACPRTPLQLRRHYGLPLNPGYATAQKTTHFRYNSFLSFKYSLR